MQKMIYSKYVSNLCGDLKNKTIVITGASSGLGLETVKILARTNSRVIVGVRNTEKMNAEIEKKINFHDANIVPLKLDLTDIKSINYFAGKVNELCPEGIDALINNAGIFAREKQVLECGIESHFFVNCLAPIILTRLLLPLLEKRKNSKTIFVSSVSMLKSKIDINDIDKQSENNSIKTYANSKRWLTFYALKLKEKLTCTNIEIVHPGISGTSLLHYSHSKLGKFGYKFVKFGMSLLFPSPAKSCLSELAAINTSTNNGEWICPGGALGVYGYPKSRKIKTKFESKDIIDNCYEKINEIVSKII